jgi:phospholipid/cholesterol/gamma-HCH transport system permease protein
LDGPLPRLEPDSPGARGGEPVRLLATGDWTSAHAGDIERMIGGAAALLGKAKEASIDVSGISALDTFGAWLLERTVREQRERGITVRLEGLKPEQQRLMAQVGRTQIPGSAAKTRSGVLTGISDIGRAVAGVGQDLVDFANMLGAIGLATFHVLVRPTRFRLTSAVHQLDRVGWQAVPIIALITLLIGGIIAQQGFFHFRRFGAETYAVDMMGILVLREIGVLIVAIMVAGRSGSSYTAELGSMKMREEIDALSTMGLDPVEILVLPRILALILALPMLAFIGDMAALAGGGLMAMSYGGMSFPAFLQRLQEAISLTHFKVGMIKAPFMALVIGVVAAMEGLKVGGSAESLGLRTTASVVKSIFLVIVLDGLFAIFFASIGM